MSNTQKALGIGYVDEARAAHKLLNDLGVQEIGGDKDGNEFALRLDERIKLLISGDEAPPVAVAWQIRCNDENWRECQRATFERGRCDVTAHKCEVRELFVAPPVVKQNLTTERVSIPYALPPELQRVGELLRTQDNRITDQPIFVVQQKRTYVTADGYNESRMIWVDAEGREASEAEAQRFDEKYAGSSKRPKGWRHLAVFDNWEFVTACFTEQGCKDFIAVNGHNLCEPRIYADGSYRNSEYRAVRSWLMSPTMLAAAPKARAAGPATPEDMAIYDRIAQRYHDSVTAAKASSIARQAAQMILDRDAAGQAKYGHTMDRGDLTLDQWLQHAAEELADGLQYLLKAKAELDTHLAPTIQDGSAS